VFDWRDDEREWGKVKSMSFHRPKEPRQASTCLVRVAPPCSTGAAANLRRLVGTGGRCQLKRRVVVNQNR
jgi:hypothetical protein